MLFDSHYKHIIVTSRFGDLLDHRRTRIDAAAVPYIVLFSGSRYFFEMIESIVVLVVSRYRIDRTTGCNPSGKH